MTQKRDRPACRPRKELYHVDGNVIEHAAVQSRFQIPAGPSPLHNWVLPVETNRPNVTNFTLADQFSHAQEDTKITGMSRRHFGTTIAVGFTRPQNGFIVIRPARACAASDHNETPVATGNGSSFFKTSGGRPRSFLIHVGNTVLCFRLWITALAAIIAGLSACERASERSEPVQAPAPAKVARELPASEGPPTHLADTATSPVFSTPDNRSPNGRPAEHSIEAVAKVVCSGCHYFPPPDIMIRHRWRREVEKMMELLDQRIGYPEDEQTPAPPSALPDDVDINQLVRYFEERAPEQFPPPVTWPPPEPGRLNLVRRSCRPAFSAAPSPAVANVRLVDLVGDARLELIAMDMRHGLVLLGRPYEAETTLEVIGRVPHPAHAEVVDLDGDGRRDLVVADLGTFLPGDHDKGKVVWLRAVSGGKFKHIVIGTGLPRVADVQPVDLDGDRDLDLVVAAFGWRQTGAIYTLEQRGVENGVPHFTKRVIDPRPGAIHVPSSDLDGDGRPDVVALIAQQYEMIIALLGRGPGRPPEERVIFRADHPNYGCSGIDLVDLDGDGDQDVVLANGDVLDDFLLKPYHGIQWLENTGSFPWKMHRLASLNGVHIARAADLDGDGDQDLIAAAFVPTAARVPNAIEPPLASLVWLEQTSPRQFERRTLEERTCDHTTLDVGDYDRDGDIDVVVGNFTMLITREDTIESWIDIWENQTN